MRTTLFLVLIFSVLLSACGGAQPSPAQPSPFPPAGGQPGKAPSPQARPSPQPPQTGQPGKPPPAQPSPQPPQTGQPGNPPPPQPPSQPPQTGQPGNPPPPPANPTPGDSGMEMYTNARSADVLPRETYLAQTVTQTDPASAWQYQTTLFGTLEAGQRYDVGGFCRVFPAPGGAGYEVTFGGAYNIRGMDESRRYEGDVRRTLSADLSIWGEPQLFSPRGGDYALDTDGQFYYLLNAHPDGWVLGKYDADFNLLKEVTVPLPPGHAANDQMLRVWDGRLYLSGLYNPNNPDMQSNKGASPEEVLYTHLWIYDADLNPVEDHILDDEPNINGGTLIPYGEGFAYISADNFLRNRLKAYIYDADWNFVRSVLLEEDGQWSMGGTLDDGNIYIAYHRGEHGRGDVMLDIFDQDWKRLEQIQVTAVQTAFNAQRPWVLVDGDTLFVAYDIGRDAQGVLDLQCMVNVYTRRSVSGLPAEQTPALARTLSLASSYLLPARR